MILYWVFFVQFHGWIKLYSYLTSMQDVKIIKYQ